LFAYYIRDNPARHFFFSLLANHFPAAEHILQARSSLIQLRP